MRVLIVDDDPLLRALLIRIVERDPRPARVFVASDAFEARGWLDRELVDVVISDDAMPGENGRDFLAYVAVRWPKVRRLLFTGDFRREGEPGTLIKSWTSPADIADAIFG